MAQVQAPKKKDDWVDVPPEDNWEDIPPEKSADKLIADTKTELAKTTPKSQPLAEVKKDPSFLESAWNAINEPLTNQLPDYLNPSKLAKRASEYVTTPELDDSDLTARLKGFAGGATEGLGNVISGLSSPLNLGTAIATGGSSLAARQGLGGAAKGLSLIAKGLAAPMAAHGAYETLRPDATLGQRAMGIAELAGGAAGVLHTPSIRLGKLGKIADNVIKPEEVPHDFNQGIDFVTDESGRPLGPSTKELTRPEGPWSMNEGPSDITSRSNTQGIDLKYDPYQSILEKQGRGELRSRPSEVPPVKSEMTPKLDEWGNPEGHDYSQPPLTPEELANSARREESLKGELPPSEDDQLLEFAHQKLAEFKESYGPLSEEYKEAAQELADLAREMNAKPVGRGNTRDLKPKLLESTVPIETGMADEIPPNVGETLEQYTQRTKLKPNQAKEIYDTYETNEIPPQVSNEFVPPESVKHTELQPTTDLKSALEQSLNQTPEQIQPKANFAFHQDDFQGGSLPLYNIEAEGHSLHRSTVSADTLREAGIDVPETPPFNPNERQPSTVQSIKATVPNEQIPNAIAKTVKQTDVAKMAPGKEKQGLLQKILDTQRTLMTAFDVSAPMRQGRPLMHTKAWWTSFDDMFKSLGSEKAYQNVQQSIKEHPSGYFEPKVSSTTGKVGKSFAEDSGLSLTDTLDNNEELFRSKWAEKVPGVRQSNRAFVAFLNKLRSDTFANMVDLAKQQGKNPETDKVLAKQIANFVNVSTGRGNLGKLEPVAKELANVFFAPRLMASKIQRYSQVFNPKFYSETDPQVRNAALKSLLTTVGTGLMMGEAARQLGAQVNDDPTNTDYRKIKIGNTRLDVFGGDQQYAVAAARLLSGKSTSSVSGKTTDLTAGRFGQKSRATVAEDFFTQKLAPLPSFVYAWMKGRDFDGMPFEAKKALLDRTVPIVMQDLKDLADKDPNLAPQIKAILAASAVMGSGVQTYGR